MADYQSLYADLQAEGIGVAAASVDPEDKAGETVRKLELPFPVGHGLDAEAVSGLTGSFYNRDKGFLHAAGFLLRPDGSVEVATYSSGPIGRLVAGDALRLVRIYKSK